MKKIITLSAAALMLVACNNTPKTLTYAEVETMLGEKLSALQMDTTLTQDEMFDKFYTIFEETYDRHLNDSIDLELFSTLLSSKWDYATTLAKYEEASDMIKENERIKRNLEILGNKENTECGKPYIDFEGEDAITGTNFKLSEMIGEKPLLVDFWASWCAPCRREIKENLINIAAEGNVNIVGIAVWEDSKDNTLKAMEELGISWRVMYTGGRENSPSTTYGVLGIPTLVLIDTDGTIRGRGHSIEEIDYFKK